MQMQASPLITLAPSSPSFNSYSSGKLAEIAARVVQEFSEESDDDSLSNIPWETEGHFPVKERKEDGGIEEEEQEEDDFEFAIVGREPEASPISADDIFYNGQIRPIYPLFNTALLLDSEELTKSSSPVSNNKPAKPNRSPLGKLLSEDRDTTSCSSSEADDLESVSADSYCAWTPKKETITDGRCKKSSSTGNSSKRWKFRDLLYRSNSDGKETFVYLSPAVKKGDEGKENKEKDKGEKGMVEKHYEKSRAVKDGDKRRSFLPYRQDLVGLFLP